MEKTLKEYLGWKCDWFEIPDENVFIMLWLPIYMPIKYRLAKCSQTIGRRIKGFWSGFMSAHRGLNWDRKSRYGEK